MIKNLNLSDEDPVIQRHGICQDHPTENACQSYLATCCIFTLSMKNAVFFGLRALKSM